MARQYVTYGQVMRGLNDPYLGLGVDFYTPRMYLIQLRFATGLSWAKLAHDLSVDSGCVVSEANARRWAK